MKNLLLETTVLNVKIHTHTHKRKDKRADNLPFPFNTGITGDGGVKLADTLKFSSCSDLDGAGGKPAAFLASVKSLSS